MKGMQEIGLLDIISHVAGVSGSTWCIADWIAHGKSIHEYQEDLFRKRFLKSRKSLHTVSPEHYGPNICLVRVSDRLMFLERT